MSDRSCCGPGKPRRLAGVAGSVIPAAVLVLLPKCPACLAAWLAVGAGIGISMPAAARLRGGILVSCVALLALAVVRLLRRRVAGSAG